MNTAFQVYRVPYSTTWFFIARPYWQLIKSISIGLILGYSASISQAQSDLTQPQNLPHIPLHAGMFNIQAEVADSAQERAIGLMHRSKLGTYQGMLFVYELPGVQCFWMKNTLIPLSIAFLSDDGTIINIEEMKPQTLNPHCSKEPVRYALEMNHAWFSKRGLKIGDKLTGQPFQPAR